MTNEQVREIKEALAELKSLQRMHVMLVDDVHVAVDDLNRSKGKLFRRRSLVRAFAAMVEGTNHFMKRSALGFGKVFEVDFDEDELDKLREKAALTAKDGTPILDDQGKPKEKDYFLPFLDNTKFAVKCFVRSSGGSRSLDCSGHGYDAFRGAIKIRDRLMHPKSLDSLSVTEDELLIITAAYIWHQAEICAVLQDCVDALQIRTGIKA